ncbi:hypothetical protein A2U01_0119345, partial [Trifolium medium]|nr:hypothetical protein [Trifolium medium]
FLDERKKGKTQLPTDGATDLTW